MKAGQGKGEGAVGRLTDDELDRLSGRRDQLVGKIQESYGYERDRAEREVDEAVRRWEWLRAWNMEYRLFRGLGYLTSQPLSP
jgi:uncharacterized protein YjbJ (UPF0337 family)